MGPWFEPRFRSQSFRGAVAQLGERLLCKQNVAGSIPVGSTIFQGSLVQAIIDFWKTSYHSDRTAFYLELVSFVFTVAASLTLAWSAAAPDMRLVYPGFFIGSVTAVIAYYRRQLGWPMLLTGYFVAANILGFSRAMGWI